MEYIRILQWSLKGNFKETVWRNTRQTDQKHHEIQISVVLGKLDNIESLLKKHIIFVLLCFAQISQTLHVCGATMIFAYFLLGIPVVVLHGLFVKLGQNISEKMGDINLFLNCIQVKAFENLRKKSQNDMYQGLLRRLKK